ncbi:MAG: hypothetical protein JSU73_11665 [candidate division WOR-3 bacterium]|nr:MAG: hypothetical protein JSU73_11665 [candidate division WOR-3 bacterium]
MTRTVEKIADEVKALPEEQLEEFLAWLADFEAERLDSWETEVAADSRPGGRLQTLRDRARDDIAKGKTKPLDEFLDNK